MEKPNTFEAQDGKMTLMDYYQSIPKYPKQDFIKEICKRCDVNENTVRNWLAGRNLPQKASYLRTLSEMTGIPEENLFERDNDKSVLSEDNKH